MNEAEIDALLKTWEERLARVDESLLALEEDPTYQLLAGRSGQRAPLDGVTRARVTPALDALTELFEHRGRLTEVLDEARARRQSAGFFDKQEKFAEAAALLNGPSIKLDEAKVPLAKRNLLGPVTRNSAILPDHLLAAMGHAFEAARDAVMQVSRAWSSLEPVMEGLTRELASLHELERALGDTAAVGAELAAIERDLAAYRSLVARDPLGVESSVAASLGPRVAGVRQRLAGLSLSRERAELGLAGAEEALRSLREGHAAAHQVPARVRAEFGVTPLPACVEDDLLLGLDEWRTKIAATAAAGRWHAADVGFTRWQETVTAYASADLAVQHAYDALVNTRSELAGRLSARRAQLQALVARGAAAPPSLADDARAADDLLRARPTELSRALAAVDAFEARVIELAEQARQRS